MRLFVAGPAVGGFAIGGPFTLTNGDGQAVSDASFRGKWMLVYFGYTRCPDACPTTLGDIANALQRMGPAAGRVTPVFITVDPARDTSAVMKNFTAAFGPAFVGLTGSDAAIRQVEKEYRVYAARHATDARDYSMDHSSIIYVMDPNGHFVTNFTQATNAAKIAETLIQLGA